MSKNKKTKIIFNSLIILFFFLPTVQGAVIETVQAAVMQSDNYKIQFDSINVGGTRQTSESYRMEDTIGEIATGQSSSEIYNLFAGYQQMNLTYISISDGANVSMSSMSSTNSTSTGSTFWTVITDNTAGYKLEIAASATTTYSCTYYLCNHSTGESFSDYAESSGTTPEVWNTANGQYEFGFSAYGTDVPTATWGTAQDCGSGTTINQSQNYRGFNNSADSGPETVQIATRSSRTGASGVSTYFCLAAVQSNVYAPSGTYTATTTATATAL